MFVWGQNVNRFNESQKLEEFQVNEKNTDSKLEVSSNVRVCMAGCASSLVNEENHETACYFIIFNGCCDNSSV